MKYLLIIIITLLLSCDLEQPKQREYTVRVIHMTELFYFEADYYENTGNTYKLYRDSSLFKEISLGKNDLIMITKNQSRANN